MEERKNHHAEKNREAGNKTRQEDDENWAMVA
jgi:hypothetical protein